MPERRIWPHPPSIQELPAAEEQILAWWQEQGVFALSLARPAPRGSFVFYEGPPTANNVPHVGHALTRAMKDLFPRFRTMRGYRVERKAGWDTHGLPVEISIERELGFTDKNAIEEYGVEAFNQRCYESVRRYEREWVKASERLGFWLDYENAYFTFTNQYIESVWWILAQMFEQGMLYEGHKVLPYCPLCGTTHSSHEIAQAYEDVKDPSATVAFRIGPDQARSGYEFGTDAWVLAWTTTPWTLPSNMACCVHPDREYRLVRSRSHPERAYLIASGMEVPVEEMVDGKPVDLRDSEVLGSFLGSELVGLRYQPLFGFAGDGTPAADGRDARRHSRSRDWTVVADPYVTLDSGTGVVHVAPAFGEDDHRVGIREGLTLYCALEANGRFKAHAGPFAGMWFKDADSEILGDLKRRGHLVRSVKYEHPYPHCWRHGTPLYYFATSSWFVRTTAIKDRMLSGNQEIHWEPDHIRDGRFGRWLEGVVDWALSRKRYWGTPLPIWRCAECGALECMGSYERLFARAGQELPGDPYNRDVWNPHRPFVDAVMLPCAAPRCPGVMQRVEEVIDCWFDAGAMPFAQHHYPFAPDSRQKIDSGEAFPADFISEAVDQTRGWFYTLHVISTFLKGGPAYRSCIVLGHVLDENGRKMSKSLGNVVDPAAIINQFGADAFRWFFYRSSPTQPSRFGPNMVRESLKSFLLPLLNAWTFFSIYAEIDGFRPQGDCPAWADRAPLDRWVLSRLRLTVQEVTAALESNRVGGAPEALERFADELTNWYIRRSRRRFGTPAVDATGRSAHWTLYEVLRTLAIVIAPFAPFIAERMYQEFVRAFDPNAPLSVHLENWPEASVGPIDEAVIERMTAARRITSLGHAARQDSGLGVRQPLASATVVTVSTDLIRWLRDDETAAVVCDELNVKELRFAADRAEYVNYEVRPDFRALGSRLGKRLPRLAAALQGLPPAEVVAILARDSKVVVEMADGDPVELSPSDVDIRIKQRASTVSAYDERVLVALDANITDELATEGLAREMVNRIQTVRKQLDLPYAAQIRLLWDARDDVSRALRTHRDLIAGEVLASEIRHVPGLVGAQREELKGGMFAFDVEVLSSLQGGASGPEVS